MRRVGYSSKKKWLNFALLDWRACFNSASVIVFLAENYRDCRPLCYSLHIHTHMRFPRKVLVQSQSNRCRCLCQVGLVSVPSCNPSILQKQTPRSSPPPPPFCPEVQRLIAGIGLNYSVPGLRIFNHEVTQYFIKMDLQLFFMTEPSLSLRAEWSTVSTWFASVTMFLGPSL